MKLRTVIDEGRIKARNVDRLMTLPADTNHDAMAGHALMQAMTALDGAGWSRLRNPVAEIRERADEILAGWTGAGE